MLKPHARNARTHSPAQLKKLEASIRRFGFVNPVLVDDEDRILAGHGRVVAAKAMGLDSVPVVYVSGMTEAERTAYVIADNRLAELAGWDDELLRLELSAIENLDLGLDLELTGFATAERSDRKARWSTQPAIASRPQGGAVIDCNDDAGGRSQGQALM